MLKLTTRRLLKASKRRMRFTPGAPFQRELTAGWVRDVKKREGRTAAKNILLQRTRLTKGWNGYPNRVAQ